MYDVCEHTEATMCVLKGWLCGGGSVLPLNLGSGELDSLGLGSKRLHPLNHSAGPCNLLFSLHKNEYYPDVWPTLLPGHASQ